MQIKEFLDTEKGYVLVKDTCKRSEDWIEVPDGAERLTSAGFFRDNLTYFSELSKEWHHDPRGWLGYEDILWQRPTKPESLPFIDDEAQSINDQYAEIEQVRQTQIGGNHYSKLAIQPMEYSLANGLDAGQHTVIKYVTRFKDKGGIEDLQKAKHTIDLLIANYYGVEK